MFNRTLFLKLNIPPSKGLQKANEFKEYLDIIACYILNKIVLDNSFDNLMITYNYDKYKVNNSITDVELISYIPELEFNTSTFSYIVTKQLENVIYDYYALNNQHSCILNVNSVVLNGDTFLLSCETFSEF